MKKNIILITIFTLFGILAIVGAKNEVNDNTVQNDIKMSVEDFLVDLNEECDSCYYVPFE